MTQVTETTELSRQRPTNEQNTTQYLAASVPVLAVGALVPGLPVLAGAAGAGQGHEHAHEDRHLNPSQPHPSTCLPIDDKNHFCAVPFLTHDSCFVKVSYPPSQNSGH